jgi:hypothetical protein
VTTGTSWQFKAPSAGKYLLAVSMTGQQNTMPPALTAASLRISINGGVFVVPALDQRFDYGLTNMSVQGSDVVALSANDLVSVVFATDTSGETFSSSEGFISITRIGN